MRFFLLTCFFSVIRAASRVTPPAGAITVGSGGQYSTVQAAVNSLSTTSTTAQSIFIFPGTYNEQVKIPARTATLAIYGYTTNTTSYANNVVTIQYSSSILSGAGNNEATGTLQNRAANTKVYNLNLKNTYGAGSQAGALSAYNTQQGYYGVGFYGYQDTLLAQIGNQVYAKCYIEGATDFIYGQHARAWFDGCDIRISGKGYITANGRSDASDVSYYVINKSTVATKSGLTLASGSTYLGRPWSQYSRVCFQKTDLGAVVNPAGWSVWGASTPNTGSVTYQEYANTGTGAAGTRASFSTKISAAIPIGDILGTSYNTWVDTTFLAIV